MVEKIIEHITIEADTLEEGVTKLVAIIDYPKKEFKIEQEQQNKNAAILAKKREVSVFLKLLQWISDNKSNTSIAFNRYSFPGIGELAYSTHDFKNTTIIFFIRTEKVIVGKVNLKEPVFETIITSGKVNYQLGIKNEQSELGLYFKTKSYKGFIALIKCIGYNVEEAENLVFEFYKAQIKNARSDKDKLDVIYENIPTELLVKLKTQEQLQDDIDILLEQDILDKLGAITGLGSNEDIGLLNILLALKEQSPEDLFYYLYKNSEKVEQLYETFEGKDRENFVALAMSLSKKFNDKIPEEKQHLYLPDGYWFTKVLLTANWSSGNVKIVNSISSINNLAAAILHSNPRPYMLGINSPQIEVKTIYDGDSLNPLDFIKVKTVLDIDDEKNATKELVTNQLALFIKYKADELKEETFWDVVNVASSLAGGYGAARVLLLKAGGWLLKTAAVIELSKEALELAMLSETAKKALKDAGLGALVENWTAISIATDVAFLSLDGLFALAKHGKKGAKALSEAGHLDEAKLLNGKTEQAEIILDELRSSYRNVQTKLAKKLGKEWDTFGNLEQVKAVEDIIRQLTKEHGMFYNSKGVALLDELIIGVDGSIDINKSIIKARKALRDGGDKFNDLVFTHNHFGNAALSPSDILVTIKNNLKEVRAVGSSGVDYSLKRVKAYPKNRKYFDIMDKVNSIMKSKYPKLKESKYINGGGSIDVAEFYAETLLKQFGDYIEYTKFTK